jgi:hypothetical protein
MSIEDYKLMCEKKEIDNLDEKPEEIKNVDIAEITRVRLYDSGEREIQDIEHGERVKLKIEYYVGDNSIERPVMGVAIRSIDNKYICGINTLLDNIIIPWNKGYNEMVLTYEHFNLTGGEYYFDVALFDETATVHIDYRTKIKTFFVKMDYIAEGIVVLQHKWNARGIVKNE